MSLHWVIAGICLILTLIAFGWSPLRRRRRVYELAAQFPGPKSYPFVGNGMLFMGRSPAEVCALIGDLARQYGDTYKMWVGPTLSVLLFNPRDVEQVLGSTQLLTKAREYETLGAWLNEGLLVSGGRKWHQRRKIITPAFHFRILEQYVEIFERQSRQMVKKLQIKVKDQKEQNWVDLGHVIHLCALDVICGEWGKYG